VFVCIAHDPEVRLRDIALSLGITELRVHGILADLTEDGYLVKGKDGKESTDGRRIRYQIQADLPMPESGAQDHAIGAVLDFLTGVDDRPATRRSGT
jgi:predicted ArsR family transcriptional regulator